MPLASVAVRRHTYVPSATRWPDSSLPSHETDIVRPSPVTDQTGSAALNMTENCGKIANSHLDVSVIDAEKTISSSSPSPFGENTVVLTSMSPAGGIESPLGG